MRLTKILILKKAFPTVKNIPLKHLLKQFKNQSFKKMEKHFNTKKKYFSRIPSKRNSENH